MRLAQQITEYDTRMQKQYADLILATGEGYHLNKDTDAFTR